MGNKNTTVLREERELTRDYTIDPNNQRSPHTQNPQDHGAYFQEEIDNFFRTPLRNGFPATATNNSNQNQIQNNSHPTDTVGFVHHVSSASNPNSNSDNVDPGKYIVNIPLGGNIGPEDLKISLKKNVMTIQAKSKKTNKNEYDSGTSSARVCQEFKKTFHLPSSVDRKQVTTVLTGDGNLKIEAPYLSNNNSNCRNNTCSGSSSSSPWSSPWPPTPVPMSTSQVYKAHRETPVPIQFK